MEAEVSPSMAGGMKRAPSSTVAGTQIELGAFFMLDESVDLDFSSEGLPGQGVGGDAHREFFAQEIDGPTWSL